jgi:hypothetical protein
MFSQGILSTEKANDAGLCHIKGQNSGLGTWTWAKKLILEPVTG